MTEPPADPSLSPPPVNVASLYLLLTGCVSFHSEREEGGRCEVWEGGVGAPGVHQLILVQERPGVRVEGADREEEEWPERHDPVTMSRDRLRV